MNSAPTFGQELLRIAPSDIHIPTRLGLYFPDKAAALGRLMATHGQRTPITVRRPLLVADQDKNGVPHEGKSWVLVTGMHRLNGALIEKLPHVFALERIGCFDTEALDEEASENLDRRDQPPLEKAIFIHATCEAARARLGLDGTGSEQKKLAAKARWDQVKNHGKRVDDALQEEADDAADTMSAAYGWEDSVAEAFGRDKRTIRRALQLHRMIIEPFPGLVQDLSDHPVVGSNQKQLLDLASIRDEAQRLAAIKLLLSDPELSADDARVRVGLDKPAGPTPVAYQKFFDQITGGWERLGLEQQRQFIPTIAAMVRTEGLKRALRDRLNEELGDTKPGALTPAFPILRSVKHQYIVCLEDGTRHINLTRYLKQLGMTPTEYRARWSLPCDYPMLAPDYYHNRVQAWRARVKAARAQAKKQTPDAR